MRREKKADKPMDIYEWYVLLDRATESINYIPNGGKNLWISRWTWMKFAFPVLFSLSNIEMIFRLKWAKMNAIHRQFSMNIFIEIT